MFTAACRMHRGSARSWRTWPSRADGEPGEGTGEDCIRYVDEDPLPVLPPGLQLEVAASEPAGRTEGIYAITCFEGVDLLLRLAVRSYRVRPATRRSAERVDAATQTDYSAPPGWDVLLVKHGAGPRR